VVAISLAALLAWRWMNFQDLLPNTVTAKSAGPSGRESVMTGLRYVGHFFNALIVPADLAIYALTLAALLTAFGTLELVIVVPIACAIIFAISVRGDWMDSYRFLMPAVPFLAALIARTAARVLERRPWPSLSLRGRAAAVAIAGLLGLMAVQQSLVFTERVGEGTFGRHWKQPLWPMGIASRLHDGFPARLAGITHWSLEHLSPRNVIATGDIGFPAWTSDAQIVDLAGLTDRELGRIVPRRDLRGYARYLKQRDPDVIVQRVAGGRPAALYDALTAGSGILSGYALVDSADTYGEDAHARIYQRPGSVLSTSRDSVMARYDRAIAWNPRVRILGRWRAEYARGHPAP
jgi:hypothetical protein